MRGTFANIRIKNEMLGRRRKAAITRHWPDGDANEAIYDAAMQYKADGTPLVIFAGKEYGTGSTRDWAAKGPALLGVKAVIAESFERIHRSNLVGMGVLPLVFKDGQSIADLGLKGNEIVNIAGLVDLKPRQDVAVDITFADGTKKQITVLCRIDTEDEMSYYRHGGILQYVLRGLASAA